MNHTLETLFCNVAYSSFVKERVPIKRSTSFWLCPLTLVHALDSNLLLQYSLRVPVKRGQPQMNHTLETLFCNVAYSSFVKVRVPIKRSTSFWLCPLTLVRALDSNLLFQFSLRIHVMRGQPQMNHTLVTLFCIVLHTTSTC